MAELRFQNPRAADRRLLQISVHSWLACMVTSKSTKKKEIWIVGALLSGRPDLTWPVNTKLIKEFEKIWNTREPPLKTFHLLQFSAIVAVS